MGCGDVEVRAYFYEYAVHTGNPGGIVRATNALMRGGCLTMNQLCEMSVEELTRIRNMGEKSIALTLRVRKRYMTHRSFLENFT